MTRGFYQTGGPFGPIRTGMRSYPRVQNPWVQSRPNFLPVGATSTPAVGRTHPVSQTVAGTRVGCCAGCAADYRQGQ